MKPKRIPTIPVNVALLLLLVAAAEAGKGFSLGKGLFSGRRGSGSSSLSRQSSRRGSSGSWGGYPSQPAPKPPAPAPAPPAYGWNVNKPSASIGGSSNTMRKADTGAKVNSAPKPSAPEAQKPVGPPPAYPGLEKQHVGGSHSAPPAYSPSINHQAAPPPYSPPGNSHNAFNKPYGAPPAYSPGFGSAGYPQQHHYGGYHAPPPVYSGMPPSGSPIFVQSGNGFRSSSGGGLGSSAMSFGMGALSGYALSSLFRGSGGYGGYGGYSQPRYYDRPPPVDGQPPEMAPIAPDQSGNVPVPTDGRPLFLQICLDNVNQTVDPSTSPEAANATIGLLLNTVNCKNLAYVMLNGTEPPPPAETPVPLAPFPESYSSQTNTAQPIQQTVETTVPLAPFPENYQPQQALNTTVAPLVAETTETTQLARNDTLESPENSTEPLNETTTKALEDVKTESSGFFGSIKRGFGNFVCNLNSSWC